jgi:hypothetical protein
MDFGRIIEDIIREAQARGEFDNLKGAGKPIDLSAYFETPEDMRMAYSILQNAGMAPLEVELLQEIAALKERLAKAYEEKDRFRIKKIIHEKQLQFNILMDRRRRRPKDR